MKLNKYQLNKVLEKISYDNETYALILKIAYIYARTIGEVAQLKRNNINFNDSTIEFTSLFNDNTLIFPIHENIKWSLMKVIEDKSAEELIFEEYIDISQIVPTMNNYLSHTGLTTQDFRILRGQHLFIEGVSVESLQKLYNHKNIISTKKIINISEFQQNEISTDEIILNYTNLNLFKNDEYLQYNSYYCIYDDEDGVIETEENNIHIDAPSKIKNKLTNVDLIKQLSYLKEQGDCMKINGVKIIKS